MNLILGNQISIISIFRVVLYQRGIQKKLRIIILHEEIDRQEDKILNLFNEFHELRSTLGKSFDEAKKFEMFTNEFITISIIYTVKFCFDNLKRFNSYHAYYLDKKLKIHSSAEITFKERCSQIKLIGIELKDSMENVSNNLINIKYGIHNNI